MADISIYGVSDDLIEVKGDASGCDEYPAEAATFVVVGGASRTRVHVEYDDGGVWSVAVAPLGEDVPMLSVAIGQTERGYSALATIQAVDAVIREAAVDA